MADVKIVLAHFYDGKAPGDSYTCDAAKAKQLYRAGIARSETKADEQAEAKAVKEAPRVSGA